MKTEMYTMINYIKKYHQHTDPWFKKRHPGGNKRAFGLQFNRNNNLVGEMHKNAAQWAVVIKGDVKYLMQIKTVAIL